MNIDALKNEFYQCIKTALVSFSKSEGNNDVYVMVLDCDSSVGMVSLRYRNKEHFQKNLETYEKNYEEYNWAIYGLHGSEYSPGECEFIDYQKSELVEHFMDSYYYHSFGDYFGEGNPIEDIKDNYKEIFWDMVVDTIKKLRAEMNQLGINVTDDFIFFHCDHDQSCEELDKMISKTVDKEFMLRLINK